MHVENDLKSRNNKKKKKRHFKHPVATTGLNFLIKRNCDRSAVTYNVMPKTKSRAKLKTKLVVPTKSRAEKRESRQKKKKSRAENKRSCQKKLMGSWSCRTKVNSRAEKKVVPEKTNVVKRKLDDKNYVALTGFRKNLTL